MGKNNGDALDYASDELKDNKEVVLEAIRQYGDALEYTSERLQDNKEVVLIASKQNGLSLKYASKILQDYKEIALEAVKENGYSLKYVSGKLKNDLSILSTIYNNENQPESGAKILENMSYLEVYEALKMKQEMQNDLNIASKLKVKTKKF